MTTSAPETTTTPERPPAELERDGLVAAVRRLAGALEDAESWQEAARGELIAQATEAKAQKWRAERAEERAEELAAQLVKLQEGRPKDPEPVTPKPPEPGAPVPGSGTPSPVPEPVPTSTPTPIKPAPVTTSTPAGRLQANGEGHLLVAATPGPVNADQTARTITGRIVPFGQIGGTNMGRFTFAAGSIAIPQDPSEIKLLVEHDQRESVGFATRLWEESDGLWATFHVPAGDPAGDLALARAANRVRNAFSVGVDLDAATLERARRARDGNPIAASGALRETSLVSVPAFTGAKVTDVAASTDPAQLVVAAWSNPTPDPSNERTHAPMYCPHCGQAAHQAGTPCPTLQASGVTTQTAPAAPPAAAPLPTPANPAASQVGQEQLQAAILGLLGVPQQQAQATAPEAPAQVPAVAGAAAFGGAQVGQEPPTYTFDGRGPSFVRDAWQARMEGSADAAARIAKFGAELAAGGAVVDHIVRASIPEGELMTAAVETRDTAPQVVQAETYRGELLIRAIDRGRPMFARMRNVRLTDATPFKVPVEGEFDGVGPHTEGTAHVAEGTLELGSVVVEPGAISGAYRFSRELADSSNPAIDGIALRAMMRDYRRQSEALVAATLALTAAGGANAVDADDIDTVAQLRAEIIAMALANNEIPPDFGFSGAGAFTAYATEEAADGRPSLPALNPSNAVGTSNIRQLAVSVDGMPLAATSGLPSAETFLVSGEDVLVGESNVLSFRFEQPEGPGIIKLALWAYQVAHVMRDSGVRRLTTATI